jgi:hypothetical protein
MFGVIFTLICSGNEWKEGQEVTTEWTNKTDGKGIWENGNRSL